MEAENVDSMDNKNGNSPSQGNNDSIKANKDHNYSESNYEFSGDGSTALKNKNGDTIEDWRQDCSNRASTKLLEAEKADNSFISMLKTSGQSATTSQSEPNTTTSKNLFENGVAETETEGFAVPSSDCLLKVFEAEHIDDKKCLVILEKPTKKTAFRICEEPGKIIRMEFEVIAGETVLRKENLVDETVSSITSEDNLMSSFIKSFSLKSSINKSIQLFEVAEPEIEAHPKQFNVNVFSINNKEFSFVGVTNKEDSSSKYCLKKCDNYTAEECEVPIEEDNSKQSSISNSRIPSKRNRKPRKKRKSSKKPMSKAVSNSRSKSNSCNISKNTLDSSENSSFINAIRINGNSFYNDCINSFISNSMMEEMPELEPHIMPESPIKPAQHRASTDECTMSTKLKITNEEGNQALETIMPILEAQKTDDVPPSNKKSQRTRGRPRKPQKKPKKKPGRPKKQQGKPKKTRGRPKKKIPSNDSILSRNCELCTVSFLPKNSEYTFCEVCADVQRVHGDGSSDDACNRKLTVSEKEVVVQRKSKRKNLKDIIFKKMTKRDKELHVYHNMVARSAVQKTYSHCQSFTGQMVESPGLFNGSEEENTMGDTLEIHPFAQAIAGHDIKTTPKRSKSSKINLDMEINTKLEKDMKKGQNKIARTNKKSFVDSSTMRITRSRSSTPKRKLTMPQNETTQTNKKIKKNTDKHLINYYESLSSNVPILKKTGSKSKRKSKRTKKINTCDDFLEEKLFSCETVSNQFKGIENVTPKIVKETNYSEQCGGSDSELELSDKDLGPLNISTTQMSTACIKYTELNESNTKTANANKESLKLSSTLFKNISKISKENSTTLIQFDDSDNLLSKIQNIISNAGKITAENPSVSESVSHQTKHAVSGESTCFNSSNVNSTDEKVSISSKKKVENSDMRQNSSKSNNIEITARRFRRSLLPLERCPESDSFSSESRKQNATANFEENNIRNEAEIAHKDYALFLERGNKESFTINNFRRNDMNSARDLGLQNCSNFEKEIFKPFFINFDSNVSKLETVSHISDDISKNNDSVDQISPLDLSIKNSYKLSVEFNYGKSIESEVNGNMRAENCGDSSNCLIHFVNSKDEQFLANHIEELNSVYNKDEQTSQRSKDEPTSENHKDELNSINYREEPNSVKNKDEQTSERSKDEPTSENHKDELNSINYREEPNSVSHKHEQTSLNNKDEQSSAIQTDEPTTVNHKDENFLVTNIDELNSVNNKNKQTSEVPKGEPTSVNHECENFLVNNIDELNSETQKDEQTHNKDGETLEIYTDEPTSVNNNEEQFFVNNIDELNSVNKKDDQTSDIHNGEPTSLNHEGEQFLVNNIDELNLVTYKDEQTPANYEDELCLVNNKYGQTSGIQRDEPNSENHNEDQFLENNIDELNSVNSKDEQTSKINKDEPTLVNHKEEQFLVNNIDELNLVTHKGEQTPANYEEELYSVNNKYEQTTVIQRYELSSSNHKDEQFLVNHIGELNSVNNKDGQTSEINVDEPTSVFNEKEQFFVNNIDEPNTVTHENEQTSVNYEDEPNSENHKVEQLLVNHVLELNPMNSKDEQNSMNNEDETSSINHNDEVNSVNHNYVNQTDEQNSLNQKDELNSELRTKDLTIHVSKEFEMHSETSDPKQKLFSNHTAFNDCNDFGYGEPRAEGYGNKNEKTVNSKELLVNVLYSDDRKQHVNDSVRQVFKTHVAHNLNNQICTDSSSQEILGKKAKFDTFLNQSKTLEMASYSVKNVISDDSNNSKSTEKLGAENKELSISMESITKVNSKIKENFPEAFERKLISDDCLDDSARVIAVTSSVETVIDTDPQPSKEKKSQSYTSKSAKRKAGKWKIDLKEDLKVRFFFRNVSEKDSVEDCEVEEYQEKHLSYPIDSFENKTPPSPKKNTLLKKNRSKIMMLNAKKKLETLEYKNVEDLSNSLPELSGEVPTTLDHNTPVIVSQFPSLNADIATQSQTVAVLHTKHPIQKVAAENKSFEVYESDSTNACESFRCLKGEKLNLSLFAANSSEKEKLEISHSAEYSKCNPSRILTGNTSLPFRNHVEEDGDYVAVVQPLYGVSASVSQAKIIEQTFPTNHMQNNETTNENTTFESNEKEATYENVPTTESEQSSLINEKNNLSNFPNYNNIITKHLEVDPNTYCSKHKLSRDLEISTLKNVNTETLAKNIDNSKNIETLNVDLGDNDIEVEIINSPIGQQDSDNDSDVEKYCIPEEYSATDNDSCSDNENISKLPLSTNNTSFSSHNSDFKINQIANNVKEGYCDNITTQNSPNNHLETLMASESKKVEIFDSGLGKNQNFEKTMEVSKEMRLPSQENSATITSSNQLLVQISEGSNSQINQEQDETDIQIIAELPSHKHPRTVVSSNPSLIQVSEGSKKQMEKEKDVRDVNIIAELPSQEPVVTRVLQEPASTTTSSNPLLVQVSEGSNTQIKQENDEKDVQIINELLSQGFKESIVYSHHLLAQVSQMPKENLEKVLQFVAKLESQEREATIVSPNNSLLQVSEGSGTYIKKENDENNIEIIAELKPHGNISTQTDSAFQETEKEKHDKIPSNYPKDNTLCSNTVSTETEETTSDNHSMLHNVPAIVMRRIACSSQQPPTNNHEHQQTTTSPRLVQKSTFFSTPQSSFMSHQMRSENSTSSPSLMNSEEQISLPSLSNSEASVESNLGTVPLQFVQPNNHSALELPHNDQLPVLYSSSRYLCGINNYETLFRENARYGIQRLSGPQSLSRDTPMMQSNAQNSPYERMLAAATPYIQEDNVSYRHGVSSSVQAERTISQTVENVPENESQSSSLISLYGQRHERSSRRDTPSYSSSLSKFPESNQNTSRYATNFLPTNPPPRGNNVDNAVTTTRIPAVPISQVQNNIFLPTNAFDSGNKAYGAAPTPRLQSRAANDVQYPSVNVPISRRHERVDEILHTSESNSDKGSLPYPTSFTDSRNLTTVALPTLGFPSQNYHGRMIGEPNVYHSSQGNNANYYSSMQLSATPMVPSAFEYPLLYHNSETRFTPQSRPNYWHHGSPNLPFRNNSEHSTSLVHGMQVTNMQENRNCPTRGGSQQTSMYHGTPGIPTPMPSTGGNCIERPDRCSRGVLNPSDIPPLPSAEYVQQNQRTTPNVPVMRRPGSVSAAENSTRIMSRSESVQVTGSAPESVTVSETTYRHVTGTAPRTDSGPEPVTVSATAYRRLTGTASDLGSRHDPATFSSTAYKRVTKTAADLGSGPEPVTVSSTAGRRLTGTAAGLGSGYESVTVSSTAYRRVTGSADSLGSGPELVTVASTAGRRVTGTAAGSDSGQEPVNVSATAYRGVTGSADGLGSGPELVTVASTAGIRVTGTAAGSDSGQEPVTASAYRRVTGTADGLGSRSEPVTVSSTAGRRLTGTAAGLGSGPPSGPAIEQMSEPAIEQMSGPAIGQMSGPVIGQIPESLIGQNDVQSPINLSMQRKSQRPPVNKRTSEDAYKKRKRVKKSASSVIDEFLGGLPQGPQNLLPNR